jgi:hypothetical protein
MLIERDPPVDWKRVVLTLRRFGWTVHGLEAALAIPRSTIYGWCNDGKQPRFEDGRALLSLYERELERRQKDALATPTARCGG